MTREVPLDPLRTHFLGRLPYEGYRCVLQISAAHVYLTYPFVLSWSMLEAMACGCLVVGSDTAPVREVIDDGVNGVLVDFFDAEAIATAVVQALQRPEHFAAARTAARDTVTSRYGIEQGVAGYEALALALSSPTPEPHHAHPIPA